MGEIALRGALVGGGHADFAPADASRTGLLEYLPTSHEHVSVDTVYSGLGVLAVAERLAGSRIALL